MDLLLDTHTLIWFLQDDKLLSRAAADAIQSPSNVSYVSMASFWEMAIKVGIDKLELDTPF